MAENNPNLGQLESILNRESTDSDMKKKGNWKKKLLPILTLGALSGSPAIANDNDGIMDVNYTPTPVSISRFDNLLPPGAANSRFNGLKELYAAAKGFIPNKINQEDLRLSGRHSFRLGPNVDPAAHYIDPLVYLTNEELSGPESVDSFKIHPKDLDDKAPQMNFFRLGIRDYYSTHEYRIRRDNPQGTEANFVKAIFYSAYANREEAEEKSLEFLQGNLETKARLLDGSMDNLSRMRGANPNSDDPNNPFNRRKVAAWAGTWLANHYWEMQRVDRDTYRPVKRLVHDKIEAPLREYVGRIRAEKSGPFYLTTYL